MASFTTSTEVNQGTMANSMVSKRDSEVGVSDNDSQYQVLILKPQSKQTVTI